MADIFISYASEDRLRAEILAKALEEQGWSVWWDRIIPPGKTFDQVIQEAINAARCVVVLWSKISIKSDWVKEEANIAKERKTLVPAKIDPVDPPIGFGLIQAADLTNWVAEKSHLGFSSLLNAISEIAGPPEEIDESLQATKVPDSKLEQQIKMKAEESETFQPDPSHLKPVDKEPPITGPRAPSKKRLFLGIGAAVLIVALSVIGWFLFSNDLLQWEYTIQLQGEYTIQQKSNGLYVDAYEYPKNKSMVLRPMRKKDPTQLWILTRVDKDTYRIQQKSNGRYVDAYYGSNDNDNRNDNRLVTADYQNNDTQLWILTRVDKDTYRIQQKSNDRYVDVKKSGSGNILLVTNKDQNGDTQLWIIEPKTY